MGIIPHAKDVRPERDYKVDLVWKFASSLVQGSLTDPGSRQVASCPDRGVQPIEIKLLELLGRRISLALGSSNPTYPYVTLLSELLEMAGYGLSLFIYFSRVLLRPVQFDKQGLSCGSGHALDVILEGRDHAAFYAKDVMLADRKENH